MGALQVTTFDKKRYSLQGGNCPFTAVEVRDTKCNHAHSLKHIEIHLTFVCVWLVLLCADVLCVQDFVDRKLVVSVRCGECTAGGGGGGGLGCLREMTVTALRTTVTITDTGELIINSDLTTCACWNCRVKQFSKIWPELETIHKINIIKGVSRHTSAGVTSNTSLAEMNFAS